MERGQQESNLQANEVTQSMVLRDVSWKNTIIGDPENWPSSLTTSVELIGNVPFPMAIAWGANRSLIYNNAFGTLLKKAKIEAYNGISANIAFEKSCPEIDYLFEKLENKQLEDYCFSVPYDYERKVEFKLKPMGHNNGVSGGILISASEIAKTDEELEELDYDRETLEFVIDAADLATWDYNPVTDKFTGNDRLKKWYGLPLDESIPLPLALAQIVEKDRERVTKAIETAIDFSSGGKYDTIYTITDGAGIERIVKAKGKAYFRDDKTAYRFNGTLEDITDEILARQALEESEQRFRMIANTAPSLIWMCDPEGMCYFANKGWLDFTGRTMEQEYGLGWTEGIHADDIERCNEIFKTNFISRKEFYLEYRLRRFDGLYRWIGDKGKPHLDIDGTFLGFIGGSTDIDDQKNFAAELELKVDERTSQLKESALKLEESNAKLNAKNRDLELAILNEFSESFAEYKIGQNFFDSLTQELAVKTKLDYIILGELYPTGLEFFDIKCFSVSAFGKVAENFQYPLFEGPCDDVISGAVHSYPKNCKLIFPENETLQQFNVEGYIGYPLFDNKGQTIGLIAAMHQEEIEEVSYVDSLLKIAAKRVELELDRIRNEKKLAEKNRELERQNEELDSFNYIASHDLQEPLRKIQTFIGLIEESEQEHFSPSGKSYFSRISASARRMQNLIKDLLTYSRADTDDILFVETDLNTLLEDVKMDLSVSAQEHKSVIICEKLPTLNVLPIQIHQLFLNLIENSIKYCDRDKSPLIRIFASVVNGHHIAEAENLNTNAVFWKISVVDNGIGFDQQYQQKIFELFQRLHSKGQYEGTGIGLAICKKIVSNHNGYISAISQPGIGSTFNIYLPFNREN